MKIHSIYHTLDAALTAREATAPRPYVAKWHCAATGADFVERPDVEAFLARLPAERRARRPQDGSYYNLATDRITMPARKYFIGADAYYSTLFHELGHWTGKRVQRLSLLLSAFQGSDSSEYTSEDMCAEITAIYLCAHFNIKSERENSLTYLWGYWRRYVKDVRAEALRDANLHAIEAADYLLTL